jgi:hypothetical protein
VSVPLSELTSQLGVAANISAKLAVHARTPHAEQIAASALKLVAREETKAEVKLTAELSAAASAEQAAIAKAATTIDHDRELALGALAHLATQARAEAHAGAQVIANEVATLSSAGKSVLVKLISELQPGSINCPSVGVLSDLAASETASVQADVTRVQGLLSILGGSLSADVSQLATVTASQLQANVCQVTDATTTETPLTGTTLASATAAAEAAVAGTITAATTAGASAGGSAAFKVKVTTATGGHYVVTEDSGCDVLSITTDTEANGSAGGTAVGGIHL